MHSKTSSFWDLRVKFQSWACECPISPQQFVEETTLSLLSGPQDSPAESWAQSGGGGVLCPLTPLRCTCLPSQVYVWGKSGNVEETSPVLLFSRYIAAAFGQTWPQEWPAELSAEGEKKYPGSFFVLVLVKKMLSLQVQGQRQKFLLYSSNSLM